MIEAIKIRSGYLSFTALSSSTHTSKLRSLISSMFSQPMISLESLARKRAYRGWTFVTLLASRLIVLQITAPQPSSKALPMTLPLVPGGPEPITKGFGIFRPLTTVSSVAMGTFS
jgi:hypothetical protein